MAESKRPEGSIWAVVSGADGKRYAGYVITKSDGVEVHYAFELIVRAVPMRDPQSGEVVQVPQRGFAPVDGIVDPPIVCIRGGNTFMSIDSLNVEDKREFERMMEEAQKGITHARLERSGIATGASQGGPGIVLPGH